MLMSTSYPSLRTLSWRALKCRQCWSTMSHPMFFRCSHVSNHGLQFLSFRTYSCFLLWESSQNHSKPYLSIHFRQFEAAVSLGTLTHLWHYEWHLSFYWRPNSCITLGSQWTSKPLSFFTSDHVAAVGDAVVGLMFCGIFCGQIQLLRLITLENGMGWTSCDQLLANKI